MKKLLLFLMVLLLSFTSVSALLTEVDYTYNTYNGWGYNLSTGLYEVEDYWSVSDKMLINPLTIDSTISLEYDDTFHHILFWNDQGQYIGYLNSSESSVDTGDGRLLGTVGTGEFIYPEGAKMFALQAYDWATFWDDTVHTTAGDIDNIATGTLSYRDIFEGTQLLTNGDFTSGSTNWTTHTYIDFSGGNASYNCPIYTDCYTQYIGAWTVDHINYISFDLNITSGNMLFENSIGYNTSGTHSRLYTDSSNGNLLFDNNNNAPSIWTLDNIVVYDLTDLFGSGNEPDLTTFETYLDYYNLYKDAQDTYSYSDIFGTSLYGAGKTNMITNGDFSNGTTNWGTDSGNTFTIETGYAKVVDNGADAYTNVNQSNIYWYNSHKYYAVLDFKSNGLNDMLKHYFVSSPVSYFFIDYYNNTEWASYGTVLEFTGTSAYYTLVHTAYTLPYDTTIAYFDNIKVYDLTDLFGGEGLEPDLETFEGYLETYTDPWYYYFNTSTGNTYLEFDAIDFSIFYYYDQVPIDHDLEDRVDEYLTDWNMNTAFFKVLIAFSLMIIFAIASYKLSKSKAVVLATEGVLYTLFVILGWFSYWPIIIMVLALLILGLNAIMKGSGSSA